MPSKSFKVHDMAVAKRSRRVTAPVSQPVSEVKIDPRIMSAVRRIMGGRVDLLRVEVLSPVDVIVHNQRRK